MAQPTPYEREFNFANQQAATPSDPIPASHLDAELNRVKLTLDQTLANLALIQADDGTINGTGIADGTVGYDQLDPDILADFIAAGVDPGSFEVALGGSALFDALSDEVDTKVDITGGDLSGTVATPADEATPLAMPYLLSSSRIRSLRFFGAKAVQDGFTADQATALLAALESEYLVDGLGLTYNFEGNLFPTAGSFGGLKDAKLKLQDQDATNRSLYILTQTDFILENVLVEGDDDRATGVISNTGLVWIDDCSNFTVDKLRATKGGPGNGITIHESNGFTLANPRVWDMNYDVAALADDLINGIWLNNNEDFTFINPQSFDFTGEIAGVASRRFTRGIAISGCSRWSMHGGFNRTVDQGLDVTGGVGNKDFTIVGHTSYDSFTWGQKFANTARDGKIIGCTSVLAGGAGFIVSPSADAATTDANESQRLLFIGCRARNPGGSALFSGDCGFAVTLGAHSTTYPQGIEFRDCEAIDDRGGGALMLYGAVNEITHPAASGFRRNLLTNFKSTGHVTAASLGFHYAFASVIGTSNGATNDSTWTDLDFTAADVEDTSSMHNPSSNANIITVRENGLYEIEGQAAFASNAVGDRGIVIRISGADVNPTVVKVPASATTSTMVSSRATVRLTDGQTVAFRTWQSSGGSLNTDRANCTATVRKVAD